MPSTPRRVPDVEPPVIVLDVIVSVKLVLFLPQQAPTVMSLPAVAFILPHVAHVKLLPLEVGSTETDTNLAAIQNTTAPGIQVATFGLYAPQLPPAAAPVLVAGNENGVILFTPPKV